MENKVLQCLETITYRKLFFTTIEFLREFKKNRISLKIIIKISKWKGSMILIIIKIFLNVYS